MCAQTALAAFHPLQVNNGKFCNFFFDIVTTRNDEICYVKHVLAPVYVFFTLFGSSLLAAVQAQAGGL